ncbi:VWA domain-containing protein, partial [Xanthovirga aplysinae]|uniref:VWA domain-containing protein n=1 Tax=Xanthovirga aplysinae TaxID=2529853 RepID=UPI001CA42E88
MKIIESNGVFERFILFGKWGDRNLREEISAYLTDAVEGTDSFQNNREYSPNLKPYFLLIDNLLATPGLRQILSESPQVKINFCEEVVNHLNILGDQLLKENWSEKKLGELSSAIEPLPKSALKRFFQKVFRKIKLGVRRLFGQNILTIMLQQQAYTKKLQKKTAQFEQIKALLSPFSDHHDLWGVAEGHWQDSGFQVLEYYDELMKNRKEIEELAELFGKYRSAEAEFERKILQQVRLSPYRKTYNHGKEDLVGLHESDDVAHLLPSEAALLGEEDTEILFYKKFVEKKLQAFELKGRDVVKRKERFQEEKSKEKPIDKGPLIICVDTSASMLGEAERMAKTLSLALLRLALKEERKCYLIAFSKKIQTLEMSELKASLPALMKFLSLSFLGGTDATPALEEAVRKFYEEDFQKADLLFISDGKIPPINQQTLSRIRLCKEKGNAFFSLVIGRKPSLSLFKDFTDSWSYHTFDNDGLKEIVEKLRRLQRVF